MVNLWARVVRSGPNTTTLWELFGYAWNRNIFWLWSFETFQKLETLAEAACQTSLEQFSYGDSWGLVQYCVKENFSQCSWNFSPSLVSASPPLKASSPSRSSIREKATILQWCPRANFSLHLKQSFISTALMVGISWTELWLCVHSWT